VSCEYTTTLGFGIIILYQKKKNRKLIPLKNMLHVLPNYSAVQKCIYTIEQKSKASDRKGLLGGKGASNKMQIGETVGEPSGGKKIKQNGGSNEQGMLTSVTPGRQENNLSNQTCRD
jgi:hypothetical protein